MPGSVRELAEVKGAIAAYEALPHLVPDNIRDLLTAHGLMMADVLSTAGSFRSKAVGILTRKRGNEEEFTAPGSTLLTLLNPFLVPMLLRGNLWPALGWLLLERQVCIPTRERGNEGKQAEQKAFAEYDQFNKQQYIESDFGWEMKRLLQKKENNK